MATPSAIPTATGNINTDSYTYTYAHCYAQADADAENCANGKVTTYPTPRPSVGD